MLNCDQLITHLLQIGNDSVTRLFGKQLLYTESIYFDFLCTCAIMHCPRAYHYPSFEKDSDFLKPGRVAQLVGHLTRKSGVLGSIPGLATYFRLSFRFFKKGSCQLLAKVCARSTG